MFPTQPTHNNKDVSPRMSTTRLSALYQYTLPTTETIQVVHENCRVEEMSIPQLQKFFGFTYAHGIFHARGHYAFCAVMQAMLHAKNSKIPKPLARFLAAPKNYFYLGFINKTCGYALVAAEDIPENTVVGIYSGEIIPETDYAYETLSLRMYDMPAYTDLAVTFNGKDYKPTLRAKFIGDLTRFATHLPDDEDIKKLVAAKELESEDSERILTANMSYLSASEHGTPMRYYMTKKDIHQGDLAGIDYGNGYWARRGKPLLFANMISANGITHFKYDPVNRCYRNSLEFSFLRVPRTLLVQNWIQPNNEPYMSSSQPTSLYKDEEKQATTAITSVPTSSSPDRAANCMSFSLFSPSKNRVVPLVEGQSISPFTSYKKLS
jgi:hypothetical protein